MLNPWPPFSSMAVRIQGLKGRHRTAQGNALGFDAIIAIKRCKRATILLLPQRHSNVVAQASQPAVSQPLSRSVNAKSMAFFFQHGGANTRPERPPQDSPGQRPGFAATVAIQRCKRATILALTRPHPNVVAQASQPAVSQPVSKPACRGLSTARPTAPDLFYAARFHL